MENNLRKAFLSTVALSLFLCTQLMAETSSGLLEKNLLEKDISPSKSDWQFNQKSFPEDLMGMRGQSVSLIDWSEDPDEATDIHRWMVKTEIQVQSPDWLARLRNARQMELVGKILSCSGTCEILRGISSVKGQYLSQILEGDELALAENSTAWVYLIDGSLLRLAAQTTVTFQEVNFAKEEVLLYLKLLKGHVHYLPRSKKEEAVDLGPETDAHSLPLLVEVANLAYFERDIFKNQNSFGHLNEYLFYDKHSKTHQFDYLNKIRKKNNEKPSIKSTLMMVTPNMTVTVQEQSFDMMYLLGGKGYFRKKSAGPINLSLRGYARTTPYEIMEERWIEVTENGRGFEFMSSANKDLELLELLTKRVVSFKIAQEVWYEAFTLPILNHLHSAKDLAEKMGYFLWDERIGERKVFLDEYTRRLETTHLQSLQNFVSKMEARGEKMEKHSSNVYYQKALDSYMWSLKTKYNFDRMQIRETNNLQYYVWILKNVKSKKL